MSRRRLAVALATIVLVAGGGVAVTALNTPDRPGGADRSALPPATADVTRGDLSDSSQQDGTLGFLGERRINAGATGTLNWIAATGSTVRRDQRLYEVDGTPVRLMYGSEPMYRTLKSGDKGKDVRQLEENLAALGYTGFTADDTYTSATASAVTRWQKSHGLKQTGTVGPELVAFAGSAVRIKEAGAATGDPLAPGKPVLTITGSERVVRFKVPVADAGSAKSGTRVSVQLPDGTRAPGRVTGVGRTAKPGDDAQDKTPKIEITVSFDRPDAVNGFDQAPVTVELTGETRHDVLSVPVNALLALSGGGFGVQLVENGATREVAVELGMFGKGRVEVGGGGLRAGMKVGVPSV
ncbi:peptidoglycan-binding protein [Streptomyces sp. NPDC059070]|uniref:peptidoglycan-binding protein n=1 Tax=Streptomyces sp. NPDC059070 TaxID=3346713 RepID=UPI0036865065